MAQTPESSKPDSNPDLPHGFSLVLGGPTFRFLIKSRLSGPVLELLRLRIIIIAMVAWLPLLILTELESHYGGPGRLSFLRDVEAHVRFLVALPMLIAAELIVYAMLRPVTLRFVDRGIVPPGEIPRYNKAIASATSLRNSVPLELGLVVLVYTFGLWLWNSRVSIQSTTWYVMPGNCWHLTPAGYWYVFVSIPIVQFALLCWYFCWTSLPSGTTQRTVFSQDCRRKCSVNQSQFLGQFWATPVTVHESPAI
ncbi:MAG: hypothetical protein WBF42_00995 [Terracidiphilus sp.]